MEVLANLEGSKGGGWLQGSKAPRVSTCRPRRHPSQTLDAWAFTSLPCSAQAIRPHLLVALVARPAPPAIACSQLSSVQVRGDEGPLCKCALPPWDPTFADVVSAHLASHRDEQVARSGNRIRLLVLRRLP